VNIAYFQQSIAWENPAANYRKVEQAFASLNQSADILIVPETFNTGFSDNMASMAEPPGGNTFQFALRMAQRHDALFIGTWTVRICDAEGHPAVVNRLHWVRPDGSFGYYDKGHTFRMSSEASQLARGCRRELFEWRGWRIKPAVCYDLRFPRWLRNGVPDAERYKMPHNNTDRPIDDVLLDYDLIIVCANWPGSRHEAWSTLLRARAIENLCYVVGVNRSGTDGTGIPYTGNSAVIDFKGLPVSQCPPNGEAVACATLHLDSLRTFRRHWPFYLDFDE